VTVEIAGSLAIWGVVTASVTGASPPTETQLRRLAVLAAVVVLVRPVTLPWIALAFAAGVVLDHRRLAGDLRGASGVAVRTMGRSS
jgi:hypothetical protein